METIIYIDGKITEYTAQDMGLRDKHCPDVDGRFSM